MIETKNGQSHEISICPSQQINYLAFALGVWLFSNMFSFLLKSCKENLPEPYTSFQQHVISKHWLVYWPGIQLFRGGTEKMRLPGQQKTPRRVMVHVIPGRRWHQLYNTAESDYPRTVYECIIFRIMSYLSLIAQLKSPIWYYSRTPVRVLDIWGVKSK